MNARLQLLLVAVGFATLGTGVTFLGFRMAMPTGSLVAATAEDTATSVAPPGRRARTARGSAGRGQGPPGRAGGPLRGPAAGAGRSLAALADELNLTAEQRQAWVHMMQTVRTTCGTEGLQGGAMALDLIEATNAGADDSPEALHSRLDARLDQQRTAAHCALNELLTFGATLSPEQRTAVATRLGQLAERRQAWIDGWAR
jgi:Spy/CpxP family protein refolding chaperone